MKLRWYLLAFLVGLWCGHLDWAILGRLTGRGKKYDPSPMSLEVYKAHIRNMGVPLFMKDNLKGIRPGPLIQEYPR